MTNEAKQRVRANRQRRMLRWYVSFIQRSFNLWASHAIFRSPDVEPRFAEFLMAGMTFLDRIASERYDEICKRLDALCLITETGKDLDTIADMVGKSRAGG